MRRVKQSAVRDVAHYKLKEEFIANAIHRLRTPLAIIKGNVDLTLREEKVPLYLRNTFRNINREVRDLSVLLSDLTFLIRKDADFARPMVFRKLELTELIRKIVRRFGAPLREQGIRVNVARSRRFFIRGDKIYIEKLFTNILGNAIKYTKAGGRISISFKKMAARLEVKIKDSGIGIPKKDLPHIFDRFYRVKKIRTVNDVGTGLGLPIARSIAEYHGGGIEAESLLGRGSTFIITLPLYKSLK